MAFQVNVMMYRLNNVALSPAQTRPIPIETAVVEYAVDDRIPYVKSLVRFRDPGGANGYSTAYVSDTVASIVSQS